MPALPDGLYALGVQRDRNVMTVPTTGLLALLGLNDTAGKLTSDSE